MTTLQQPPTKQQKTEQAWLAKQLFEKATAKTSVFKTKFKEQVSTAILTAFGLVIALAWKDVITDVTNKLNPLATSNLLISAFIVTAISVVGMLIVSVWNKPLVNV